MTKLTRKLFISILTVAFAFVTLGATTFAWFTLTTTAEVDTFNATMHSGTGIEMSLDGGVTYKNYFTETEILAAIARSEGGTVLNLVTSFDGISMTRHQNLYIAEPDEESIISDWGSDTVLTSDYIIFDVWFRSPTEGARIYLLKDTKTSSTGKSWKPDGTFEYGYYEMVGEVGEEVLTLLPKQINTGSTAFMVYLADTLRMSFQKYDLDDATGDEFVAEDLSPTTNVVIYELDPDITGRETNLNNPKNHRLDTAVVQDIGMVPYYNKKNVAKPINEELIDLVDAELAETTIYDNSDLVIDLEAVEGKPLLLELTAEKENSDGYYYGYMKVRIWAEGWDPDAFNSVLGASLSIDLAFGGADPEETGGEG